MAHDSRIMRHGYAQAANLCTIAYYYSRFRPAPSPNHSRFLSWR